MASVPLSEKQLEDIAVLVAQDLLESWAIDDRFNEEDLEKAKDNAVNDACFVINNFMEHVNSIMLEKSIIK